MATDTDNDDIPRRAWELREDFRSRGLFTTAEYRETLAQVLPGLSAEALDALAERVDEESTRERPRTGLFNMEGEYRLRRGRRVAKRMALLEHMEEVLAISSERVAALTRRN
jgi:hypothetical protein